MRRVMAPFVGLLLLAAVGCGGNPDGSPTDGSDTNELADVATDLADLSDLGSTVPVCPFDAAEVSQIVGQSMVDSGSCSFGDGNGVAMLTVTLASEFAGTTTYTYALEQAALTYDTVSDLDEPGLGFMAVEDGGGQAVIVTEAGSYTITISAFERLDAPGYARVLRALLDAALD